METFNSFKKKSFFTVLSFGQVTDIFSLLYSVILQGQIRLSFFGHLNSPQIKFLTGQWSSDRIKTEARQDEVGRLTNTAVV